MWLISTMKESTWETLKAQFDNKCVYCTDKPKKLVPDHLVPHSRNGELVVYNTVPSCGSCNDSKSDHDWQEWITDTFCTNCRPIIIDDIKTKMQPHLYTVPKLSARVTKEMEEKYNLLLSKFNELYEEYKTLNSEIYQHINGRPYPNNENNDGNKEKPECKRCKVIRELTETTT